MTYEEVTEEHKVPFCGLKIAKKNEAYTIAIKRSMWVELLQ